MRSFLGHIRPCNFGLPLLVAVVCALSSFGWAACTAHSNNVYYPLLPSGYVQKPCYYQPSSCGCDNGCQSGWSPSYCSEWKGYCQNGATMLQGGAGGCPSTLSHNGKILTGAREVCGQYQSICNLNSSGCFYDYECTNQVDADSIACLNAGNVWLNGSCCDEKCSCENGGGVWDENTNSCGVPCNDHVTLPDRCEELWKNGYSTDGDGEPGGGGYWAIVTYECFYDSCAMSLNCQEKSSFPAGNLNCSDFFQDSSGTPGRCVGVVGFQCIMQCGSNTINCDCDGSCQKALDIPGCACPSSSSSPGSSSSQNSSSSGQNSSSSGESSSDSGDNSSSSTSPGQSSGSGGDWEYSYYPQFDTLNRLNRTQVGYLSDIDRILSNINANGLKVDNSATLAAVTEGTAAQRAGNDTLHSMHSTLDRIDSALNQQVEEPDISDWLSSASGLVDELYSKARDTTTIKIGVDSLKADTSQFKTKYSSLFISNAYTRTGCYVWTIKDSGFLGKVGHKFKLGASVDFGSIGGFDLCAILRGLVRACGAILCLLITIKAYRSAFSSSDG